MTRILDASALINLLSIEVSVARKILIATGLHYAVTDLVLHREVLVDPRDRSNPGRAAFDAIASGGVIGVVSLDEAAEALFVDLAFEMDDGEASILAYSGTQRCVGVLDDRVARAVAVQRSIAVEWTLDVLLHPEAEAALGREVVAAAVFDALFYGRMRVPSHRVGNVVQLIGTDRASQCASLPKWAGEAK